ncbi:hypothetical protein [Janibacter melonis]|uniref:hypothetical protein n=1 Tax=Janibacter melonis TaxID=262209 RepID=UPI00174B18B1|nr:hypothetical protein [Janibacter melonis]
MARTNGGIVVWNDKDTVPTDGQGGYSGGDSTAAAMALAGGQAQAALTTMENLKVTVTHLPYGSGPTYSVSGSVPNRTLNFGLPAARDGQNGRDGMGYAEGQQLVADSAALKTSAAQAALAAQQAAAASLNIPDTNVASVVNNPTTQTAKALRDGYAPRTLVPATRAQAWGHSFMSGVGIGTSTAQGMAPLIAGALDLPLEQHAVGGTALYNRLSADSNWRSILRDVTRPASTSDVLAGFYQAMYGMNDIANLGLDATALLPFRHALRFALSRFRSTAFFPHTHSSIAYGGTGWATNADIPTSGSSITRNATAGATITITADLPGGYLVPVFMCWTEAGGGAVFSGSGDAAGYTLDTRTIGRTDSYTVSCLRVPAKKGPGTYTFTTSNISGAIGAIFLGWQWEPADNIGPVVAVVKQPKPLDYEGYASSAFKPTDASIDTLNALQDSLVAEFGQRVFTVDTSVMDKSTTYFVPGNVHPTVAGHAKLAELVATAIKRAAAFVSTPADVVRTTTAGGSGTTSPADTRITWGTAAPTSGTWKRGDVCFNENAAPNVRSGWICTAAGTPGTWNEMQPTRIGSGQATLVDGSATVTYAPGVTTATQVRVWHVNVQRGGTPGALYISGKSGTSFTVSSTSPTDNSSVQWEILG